MNDETRDALTPNEDRSLDQPGQNQADIKLLAEQLLSDVAFAAALMSDRTARDLATLDSDVELAIDDRKAGEIMHTHALVSGVKFRSSFIAPLMKRITKSRDKQVRRNYELRSNLASRKRLQHATALIGGERHYRTYRIEDPPLEDVPIIDIQLEEQGDWDLALTPYQIQAAGVVECVRACGQYLGLCDGTVMADRFMHLILTLGDENSSESDLAWARQMAAGGFLELTEELVPPLTPNERFKAQTILAAWIRMARLGVDLFDIRRLQQWHLFFDGTLYGSDEEALGEVWRKNTAPRSMERSDQWRNEDQLPWMMDHRGSPIIAVGIAGELLKMAILRVQISGFVPDDFDMDYPIQSVFDKSEKTMLRLKNHYRDIAGSTLGSVVSVDLNP